MTTRTIRKMVKIDEEKCNGCGACTIKCAEGALQIIDGKARLISDQYCDGLGACLGECPEGAITIEERAAEDFSEEAVERHIGKQEHAFACPSAAVAQFERHDVPETLPCGCPSASVTQFEQPELESVQETHAHQQSMLGHWPVQLTLVPPGAPFLQGADLLLTAHCVPFAHAGFHQDLLKGHALLIACPKLDDVQAHLEKLTQVLTRSQIKSITVARMEVPCCSGLTYIARQAITASGKNIPFKEVVISTRGEVAE
ncbi:MAG: 4Fe-4S binding protein [Chloroflexi bacterium]|nr:4Fe-4S binding protein [Chloroflexota bacterium]